MSIFGKIVCTLITVAVLYGFGRLLRWAIETHGYGYASAVAIVGLLIVYLPWIVVGARRGRRLR